MKKILLGLSLVVGLAGVASVNADEVSDRYTKTCAVCHASGAAGAPKTHVAADWAPRMTKGMDVLIASVNNGLNAMPPKGMCFDCNNDQFKALIEFMAKPQ